MNSPSLSCANDSRSLLYSCRIFSLRRIEIWYDAFPISVMADSTAYLISLALISAVLEFSFSKRLVSGPTASSVRAWRQAKGLSLTFVLFEHCAAITGSRDGVLVTATFGSTKASQLTPVGILQRHEASLQVILRLWSHIN